MAAPVITDVTPVDGSTTVPTGESIQILFNQEISEFLLENSISLIGPDNHIATGVEFEEKLFRFANESKYAKSLDTYLMKGEVPIEIEVYRCDSSGNLLTQDIDGTDVYVPYSYAYNSSVKTKVVIKPKSFLQEKTEYRLLISGSPNPNNEWSYVGSRSVFDPAKDPLSTGDGILRASGYYIGTVADEIVVTVTKTGSSTTCKLEWYFSSSETSVQEILPFAGRNKILTERDIYFELIGGAADAFKAGDQWTIQLRPTEYLIDTYKLDFATAAEQVRELPASVSQSPVRLGAPTQAEIEAAATEFQLLKIEPEYGSSNISLKTKQIILTFNKDVDPTSVTADTVKLFRNIMDGNQDAVDVGYSWIVNGKKIIINIIRE
jgi:hypothetical protein